MTQNNNQVRKIIIVVMRLLFITGGILLFLSAIYNPELIRHTSAEIIILLVAAIDIFCGCNLFTEKEG